MLEGIVLLAMLMLIGQVVLILVALLWTIALFSEGGLFHGSFKSNALLLYHPSKLEYKAYLDATSDALWIQQILSHLGCSTLTSTTLFLDLQSAIALAHNPIVHGQSRHIDVLFHFVCDYITDGRISLEYCPTKDNIADLLTKPLPRPTLDHLLHCVGIGPSLWS